jgi:hypothetical protein
MNFAAPSGDSTFSVKPVSDTIFPCESLSVQTQTEQKIAQQFDHTLDQ